MKTGKDLEILAKEIFPAQIMALQETGTSGSIIYLLQKCPDLLRKAGYVQESEVRGMRWVTLTGENVPENFTGVIRSKVIKGQPDYRGIHCGSINGESLKTFVLDDMREWQYLDESTQSPLYTEAELQERLQKEKNEAYWEGWEAYGESL